MAAPPAAMVAVRRAAGGGGAAGEQASPPQQASLTVSPLRVRGFHDVFSRVLEQTDYVVVIQ